MTSPLSPIPAPKVLLMGWGGTGKTYSLRTLVDQGVIPFVLALDTQGIEVLGDIPASKLHWHGIAPENKTWKSMIDDAKRLQSLTYEGITKSFDPMKHKQRRWISTLETLAEFKCDRTGESFGMVDNWGTNRAIVIDHLTELGQASKEFAVGEKLVLHEGEWQVAQNNVENLIRQLVQVCRCWVILIAHIDREQDLIRGGTRIMAAALGRKLSPKLYPLFSDVVLAEREGKEFRWSTAQPDTDLKTRNLPIETKLRPDFGEIVRAWKARGGSIEGGAPAS